MATWRVEVKTSGREVYLVEADSEQEALKNWDLGEHELSEVLDAEAASANRLREN